MKPLTPGQKGSLYAIFSGLLYGFIGYFGVKILAEQLSIPNMIFWRFILSSVVIGLILLCRKTAIVETPKEMFKVFCYGAVFYSFSPIIYFIACRYIGTGLSMVIFFAYPAIVMLFNWLLYKSKITTISYLSIMTILVGMLCLVDMRQFTFDMLGIGLGLLSATCFAFYVIASKKSPMSPLASTFMTSLGCAFTSLIIALVDQSFFIPQTTTVWLYLLGYAIISTALPMLFFLEALKYINSEKTSILSVLEPVFVVILGVMLLGEKINLLQAFGVVIVLSGAFMELLSRHLTRKI